ncbi:hypothetical protein HZH68_008861 [Vespula germanica]|uniref:Uncharacterized protein n=1 Tax=Vespula germanica TaxID=30212 RepID=A0A834N7E9_VESGE|nr:hypothetical protein HZH68_008861 [Vespula germanica]
MKMSLRTFYNEIAAANLLVQRLGIYGDSNSESEEEQNEQEQLQNNDSDEELMETLRRRQQAFKKTEKEIEARLAAEEENEDQYNVQQENHIGNTSCRDTVDEKETVNIQRAASESLSSDGQSPREVNASADVVKAGTPSASVNSESSNSESTSSDTSHNSTKKNKKLSKKSDRDQRKRKSKSRRLNESPRQEPEKDHDPVREIVTDRDLTFLEVEGEVSLDLGIVEGRNQSHINGTLVMVRSHRIDSGIEPVQLQAKHFPLASSWLQYVILPQSISVYYHGSSFVLNISRSVSPDVYKKDKRKRALKNMKVDRFKNADEYRCYIEAIIFY